MSKKIDDIATILLIILGFIHIILTPIFYKTFDLDSLWFAGTGLAFLFLGFINIFRIRTTEMFIKKLCSLGNAMAFVYCILIVLKLSEPQAFVSLIVLLIIFGLSLVDLKQSKSVN